MPKIKIEFLDKNKAIFYGKPRKTTPRNFVITIPTTVTETMSLKNNEEIKVTIEKTGEENEIRV